MLVSVVITTKNEEKNIKNCLESILKQSFPAGEMEIIVVDNNSTDKTRKIVRGFINGLAPLNMKLFNGGPERSAQRNFGIKKAEGKYFLYLDADMTISPNLIEECASKLENNQDVVALYIPEIISGKSFWNKVRNFERSFYNGTVIDVVRFVRKGCFEKVGGFDESLTGPEDWDFDKKIKKLGETEIVKNPLYHHEESFQLKDYLKKKAYYGQYFAKYIAKWGKKDLDIKKQFGIFYRYIGVFVKGGKWKKILRHPILMAGVFFLRFLVGTNYLIKK